MQKYQIPFLICLWDEALHPYPQYLANSGPDDQCVPQVCGTPPVSLLIPFFFSPFFSVQVTVTYTEVLSKPA